jgi:hypothetical protein
MKQAMTEILDALDGLARVTLMALAQAFGVTAAVACVIKLAVTIWG